MEPEDRKIRSPLPLTEEELDKFERWANGLGVGGIASRVTAAARAHLDAENTKLMRLLSGTDIHWQPLPAPPAPGEDIENTSLHGLQLPSPDNAMSYWDGEYWKASPDNAKELPGECPECHGFGGSSMNCPRCGGAGFGVMRNGEWSASPSPDNAHEISMKNHAKLVERLRECGSGTGATLAYEAADALAALREENERLRNIDENYFYGRGRVSRQAQIDVLNAENERLKEVASIHYGNTLPLEAENARLREALEKIGAYEHIPGGTSDKLAQIARTALKEKG